MKRIYAVEAVFESLVFDGANETVSICQRLAQLWNMESKREFHREYTKYRSMFNPLIELRRPLWIKPFASQNDTPALSSLRSRMLVKCVSIV